MDWVEIIKLDLVKKSIKWNIFEFENRNVDRMLLIERKKWTISGNHYHTWKVKTKNPEIFIILNWEVEIHFINIKTKEEFKEKYIEPMMFKVNSYIIHKITALTNILLIDMNSFDDDNKDTIKIF